MKGKSYTYILQLFWANAANVKMKVENLVVLLHLWIGNPVLPTWRSLFCEKWCSLYWDLGRAIALFSSKLFLYFHELFFSFQVSAVFFFINKTKSLLINSFSSSFCKDVFLMLSLEIIFFADLIYPITFADFFNL